MLSFFLFSLLSFACSSVITITEKTWQKDVLDSTAPVFVKFYAPWCGHCKSLAPVWEKVATNLKGVVPIVKVDCTSEQSLCSKYGVNGYPTLKLFKNKGKSVDYNGGRDMKSLVNFATGHIKSSVEKITSEEGLEKFLAKHPSIPHVLLFSEKPANSLYQVLSMRYEGKILFGHVKNDVTAVTSRYSVESFPHIVTLINGNAEHFEGTIDKDSLVKLAKSLASGVKEEATPDEETPKAKAPPTPKAAPKKQAKPIQEVTQENIETTCKGTLCVITLFDGLASAANAQNEVVDEVYAKYNKDSKFTFGFSHADSLSKLFKVENKPAVVVYNAKKGKFALAPEFTVEGVSATLNRALSGDLTYTKIQKEEL